MDVPALPVGSHGIGARLSNDPREAVERLVQGLCTACAKALHRDGGKLPSSEKGPSEMPKQPVGECNSFSQQACSGCTAASLPAGILLQLRVQAHLLQGNGIEIVALRVVQVVGKHGDGAPIVGVVFAGAFIDAI